MNAKYPKSKRKDTRRRFQFRFWLDVAQDEWYDLAQRLESLKQSRQYAPTIRKALTLYLSLKDKRIDYLLELFPWIEDALQTTKPAPPDTSGGGDLKRDIDQIKQLILSQGKPDGLVNSPAGNPKPLAVPAIRTPKFDDLGNDDLVLRKDTSTDAGKNFIQSMMNLQA